MERLYYVLYITTWGYDWENEEYHIFNSQSELGIYRAEHESRDWKNVNGINGISYTEQIQTESQIRDIATVNEYAALNPAFRKWLDGLEVSP